MTNVRFKHMAAAVLAVCLAACQQQPLLEGLDERQANEVIAVLLHDNISVQKKHEGKAGYRVSVGGKDLAQAIDLIHRAELPSTARRHVSADFAADAMVSTPQAERVRLLSCIEQRLEESLTQFSGVIASRVHVSYPTETGGLRARTEPAMHLSALLVMDRTDDEAALIQSVKRLLRNSFEHVAYEDISVLLTPAGDARPTTTTPGLASPGSAWIWLASGAVLMLVLACVTLIVSGKRRLSTGTRQWWKRRFTARDEVGT